MLYIKLTKNKNKNQMKYANLTVIDTIEGVKSGSISCEELVWEIYGRIERSELNAFITLNKENALAKAREVDKKRNEEEYNRKKLLGVPIAIKDSISTRGIQTTCASKILDLLSVKHMPFTQVGLLTFGLSY